MKIDIDPKDISQTVTKGYYKHNPPGSSRYRDWVPATYKQIHPGDLTTLGGLPYFGVILLDGREFLVGNTYTKTVHIIDADREELHKADPGLQVEWLGYYRGGVSLKAGQGVRVMHGSKWGGEIFMVMKDGHSKIQCIKPGQPRVVIERQWLIPIEMDLVERP